VHNVSDARQIEAHTAEPLVPGLSPLKFEIATEKFKKVQDASKRALDILDFAHHPEF
jgi:hypothetical protein